MKEALLNQLEEKRTKAEETLRVVAATVQKVADDGVLPVQISIFGWAGDTSVKKEVKVSEIEIPLREAISQAIQADSEGRLDAEDVEMTVELDNSPVHFYGDDEDATTREFSSLVEKIIGEEKEKKNADKR